MLSTFGILPIIHILQFIIIYFRFKTCCCTSVLKIVQDKISVTTIVHKWLLLCTDKKRRAIIRLEKFFTL